MARNSRSAARMSNFVTPPLPFLSAVGTTSYFGTASGAHLSAPAGPAPLVVPRVEILKGEAFLEYCEPRGAVYCLTSSPLS